MNLFEREPWLCDAGGLYLPPRKVLRPERYLINGVVAGGAASGGGYSGPIALIAGTPKAVGSSNANSVTTGTINATGGNFAIAAVGSDHSAGTPDVISSPMGFTWHKLTSYAGASNQITLYHGDDLIGTNDSETVTLTSSFPAIAVAWFSGFTSNPFDKENGINSITTTTTSPGAVDPTADNSLIVTAVAIGGTGDSVSIDNGFTILAHVAGDNTFTYGVALAYKLMGTHVSVNPTWTVTSGKNCISSIAVFK